jgi:hypothetical protein
LAWLQINSKGAIFLLERSSDLKWTLNYKFLDKIPFENGLNFKLVQTFWEKSIILPQLSLDMVFNTENLD